MIRKFLARLLSKGNFRYYLKKVSGYDMRKEHFKENMQLLAHHNRIN